MNYVMERERQISVKGEYDVIVCGGGPAGICAAIAAARAGASTALFEVHGCIGGIWTAGLLSWMLDTGGKHGILQEIIRKLEKRDAGKFVRGGNFICDAEQAKLLFEELCIRENIKVQLHTRVVEVFKSNNRIKAVITESKSGREAWMGKVFIDTTGDGDVAAYAGCGFDMGRPDSGETQPMSLITLVSGILPSDVEEFNNSLEYRKESPKKRLLAEIQKAGITPSYTDPALWHIKEDLFILMSDHQYLYNGTDAAEVTQATFYARAEINKIVSSLRSLGGIWKELKVIATAEQIGVREGRRIHGHYTVLEEDIKTGKHHEDGICHVNFKIDIHATNPEKSTGYDHAGMISLPYDIPLRALIAKDTDGLLMAGRCISGDFVAHSSYRVTGNAAATGEAAGILAAIASTSGKLPQEVHSSEVKRILTDGI